MKNKNYLIALIGLISAYGLFSCSSDESTPEAEEVTLLQQSTWVMTAKTLNGNDLCKSFDKCSKDNELSFMADSVLVEKEGPLVCTAGDPGPWESKWHYNDDYTILSFNKTAYEVQSLTATELNLKESGGSGATILLTYSAK